MEVLLKEIERLKSINSKLKLNHKIGNRDIADKEVMELTKVIDKLLEPFQELVDKATPTKPIKVPGVLLHDCSACGGQIDFMPDFCGHCGQAIDWEEE